MTTNQHEGAVSRGGAGHRFRDITRNHPITLLSQNAAKLDQGQDDNDQLTQLPHTQQQVTLRGGGTAASLQNVERAVKMMNSNTLRQKASRPVINHPQHYNTNSSSNQPPSATAKSTSKKNVSKYSSQSLRPFAGNTGAIVPSPRITTAASL